MSRERVPVIYCDGDDGECGEWEQDYWACLVSSVGGIPITREHPAPGWVMSEHDGWVTDLCPEHTPPDRDDEDVTP